MAQSVRRLFGADVGLSVTGVAGPGGGTAEKPVGLVFVHLSVPHAEWGRRFQWAGGRAENKAQSAEAALLLLQDYLTQNSTTAPSEKRARQHDQ
jgi:nicotinamide mononucleotide (NMN) deamidase PncC